MKRGRQYRLKRVFRLLLLLVILQLLWMTLPYDHPIRLSVRFNFNAFSAVFFSAFQSPWWSTMGPAFPVTLPDDVAVVVKSGFGTKDRIPAWLKAHEHRGLSSVLLIADFASQLGQYFSYDGQQLPVYDMIAETKESGSIPGDSMHPRLCKYVDLRSAISKGDLDAARDLSVLFGWELDTMKFISGLELCYHQMPDKKWYLMVDDDTYLVQQSLHLLLEHLDPNIPYYIGNAVGDYRARFAHGGSGVILSRAAVYHLFSHPEVVSTAHKESLEETWGDRLLARTLINVGIYLDEAYALSFNGEDPWKTKLTVKRSCLPILSFHGLKSLKDMVTVDEIFRKIPGPIHWIDLWDICDAPAIDSPIWKLGRKHWDHVGGLDEVTATIYKVQAADACAAMCQEHAKFCLAWTWESETQACRLSPWMIPGVKANGKVSGINVSRVKMIANRC